MPYSAEIADRVLGELMEGRTLIDVCDDPGMPPQGTVLLWVRRDRDGFAARYKEAREIGGQIMVDELIEIGDDRRRDWIMRRRKERARPSWWSTTRTSTARGCAATTGDGSCPGRCRESMATGSRSPPGTRPATAGPSC